MKILQDYFNYITGIVDKCEIVVNRAALCRGEGKNSGEIMAPDRHRRYLGIIPDGLLFQDGALLNLQEEVQIQDDGTYALVKYNYHYQRPDGYFFRYDKVTPTRAAMCNEPERHLHANIEDIRFPTHCTNLEEILKTIQRNFYQ